LPSWTENIDSNGIIDVPIYDTNVKLTNIEIDENSLDISCDQDVNNISNISNISQVSHVSNISTTSIISSNDSGLENNMTNLNILKQAKNIRYFKLIIVFGRTISNIVY
jgi:hypothetical protein